MWEVALIEQRMRGTLPKEAEEDVVGLEQEQAYSLLCLLQVLSDPVSVLGGWRVNVLD